MSIGKGGVVDYAPTTINMNFDPFSKQPQKKRSQNKIPTPNVVPALQTTVQNQVRPKTKTNSSSNNTTEIQNKSKSKQTR